MSSYKTARSRASPQVQIPSTKPATTNNERTPLIQSPGAAPGTAPVGTAIEDDASDHHSTSSATLQPPKRKHTKAGSMNMRALVLHVLGDALGNVGVIATGLIIWLTHLSWKNYFDPIISLVITCIIFSSALPLGEWSILTLIHLCSCCISQECFFHPLTRCPVRYLTPGGR